VASNLAVAKNAPPASAKGAAAKSGAPAKAADAEAAPAPAPGAPPKKKRSKLLKPLLGALALSAAAAGAWHGGLRNHPALAFEAKTANTATKGAPTFLPVEMFTVNLLDTDRERYLQIGIVVELNDARMLDAVKLKMPIIRSQILMQLANKRMADLLGMQAKEKLALDIVARVRQQVESEAADRGIEKVHFSQFIIQ
jgi:flagellar FliL protein